jgi:hypothetical protein
MNNADIAADTANGQATMMAHNKKDYEIMMILQRQQNGMHFKHCPMCFKRKHEKS